MAYIEKLQVVLEWHAKNLVVLFSTAQLKDAKSEMKGFVCFH